MIDAAHLKAYRIATGLLKKGLFLDVSDAPKGRPELQAPRRLRWPRSTIDYASKRRADERLQWGCLDDLCAANAKTMLGDRGYDADWFRAALNERSIAPFTSSKAKNYKILISHDTVLYR